MTFEEFCTKIRKIDEFATIYKDEVYACGLFFNKNGEIYTETEILNDDYVDGSYEQTVIIAFDRTFEQMLNIAENLKRI